VEKALRHVAQTLLLLAGYDNPRRTYSGKELDLPFQHLLKGYKEQDPAPKLQLVLPVTTIEHTGAYHQAPQHALTWATADLIIIGFFFYSALENTPCRDAMCGPIPNNFVCRV
jgi:hypothetical protein